MPDIGSLLCFHRRKELHMEDRYDRCCCEGSPRVEPSDFVGEHHPKHSSGCHNKELGARGEEAAAWYLRRRGYDILERNWRCFAGEADIIARDGDALVFVEVKTRTSIKYGFPAEAVDAAKRDRYEKIALAYLADYEYTDIPIRFDVISIVAVSNDRACVRHQISAFSVS